VIKKRVLLQSLKTDPRVDTLLVRGSYPDGIKLQSSGGHNDSACYVIRDRAYVGKKPQYRLTAPELVVECLSEGTQQAWRSISQEGHVAAGDMYSQLFPTPEKFPYSYLDFPGAIRKVDKGVYESNFTTTSELTPQCACIAGRGCHGLRRHYLRFPLYQFCLRLRRDSANYFGTKGAEPEVKEGLDSDTKGLSRTSSNRVAQFSIPSEFDRHVSSAEELSPMSPARRRVPPCPKKPRVRLSQMVAKVAGGKEKQKKQHPSVGMSKLFPNIRFDFPYYQVGKSKMGADSARVVSQELKVFTLRYLMTIKDVQGHYPDCWILCMEGRVAHMPCA